MVNANINKRTKKGNESFFYANVFEEEEKKSGDLFVILCCQSGALWAHPQAATILSCGFTNSFFAIIFILMRSARLANIGTPWINYDIETAREIYKLSKGVSISAAWYHIS